MKRSRRNLTVVTDEETLDLWLYENCVNPESVDELDKIDIVSLLSWGFFQPPDYEGMPWENFGIYEIGCEDGIQNQPPTQNEYLVLDDDDHEKDFVKSYEDFDINNFLSEE